MIRTADVRSRWIETAFNAGQRWNQDRGRREETARQLSLGGAKMAESPDRMEKYQRREAVKLAAVARAGLTTAFLNERMIGPTLDLDENPPSPAARVAGIPVGRIVELDDQDNIREGFATGFLIGPNLVMTNHHVFTAADEAGTCGIQFGYELINGVAAPGTTFRLDTAAFFYTNEKLDFTIVGVSASATDRTPQNIKPLPLIPITGKILVGQPISIIQYPEGKTKRYGVRNNTLLTAPTPDDLFLQYTTDTLPGSSGSPAYNEDWEVVGLHHSGVPAIDNGHIVTKDGKAWDSSMPDSDIRWVANEGVRVSCICADLAKANVASGQQAALQNLVSSFGVENFASLPVLQSGKEERHMEGNLTDRAIAITVNGTANFYMSTAAGTAPVVKQPGLVDTAKTIPAPEKKLRFDPDYDHRPGYQEKFLGIRIPLPGLKNESEALKGGNGKVLVLDYHHYSLVMSRERKLQIWSAVNVDYTSSKRRKQRQDFGTDTWVADPRIPGKDQIEDQELYAPALKFDRGHIVRREDTAWGDTALEEIYANSDSFHWTNCTPQHEQFNRAEYQYHGLWGGLENQIKTQATNVGNRMCIFAGPILDNENDIEHDFGGGSMLVPRRFWKVLLVVEEAGTPQANLQAYGFILDQSDAIEEFGLEKFSAGKFATYQCSLKTISDDARVTFAAEVMAADTMAGIESVRLESAQDVRVGKARAKGAGS